MYLTREILEKLNAHTGIQSGTPDAEGNAVTLSDIMVRSFAEVKQLAGDALTWGEKNFLYQQAQKELKENKMAESRILSRANPQLANAVRLGIRQSSMLGSYNDLFPQPAGSFVKAGSVASMFSPAGYLTELYREAKGLHADTSAYHLDTRRPDLASLSLSQTNMDVELSTLSLSNELLLNNIQTQEGKDYDGVMEMLAAYRQTSETPYSQPYEAVRQSIILQDPEFAAFRNNPAVAAKMDASSLSGIQANISPELRKILIEEITEDNADELIEKNFGDINIPAFQDIGYLARWYGLSSDEINSLSWLIAKSVNVNPDTPAGQYYTNDQFTKLIQTKNGVEARTVRREYVEKDSGAWVEIIPAELNKYQINVSFDHINNEIPYPEIGIGSDRYYNLDYKIVRDHLDEVVVSKIYSYTHELTSDDRGIYLSVGLLRGSSPNSHVLYKKIYVNFTVVDYSFKVYLLRLNKFIRLFKATGCAPADIVTVIESCNNDQNITTDVLSRLFRVNYYMQQYGIDASAALVLSGANIGQVAHSNQASAFTRLFNAPMLSNAEFSADGTAISLAPGKTTDTFRSGVIKRAFGVSDTELYTLWSLTRGSGTPEDFTCTMGNLSALYRTKLLADVNGLSVTELAALLSVSPYATRATDALSGTELAGLVSAVSQYTGWLKDMNWTVSDLYLMLTDSFSITLTPDIENLLATLNNGLASQDLSEVGEAGQITAMAPFIAAATRLDSAETAAAVLQWLSQLKPLDLTIAGFLELADNDSRTDAQTSSLVAYCQVMGQLTLFVRMAGLTSTEVSWGVAHPTMITENATALNHDIATLHDLTQLHALLARCGTYATEILTSLSGKAGSEKNNLAIKTVATALNLDELALTQALAQCSPYAYFYSWIHLRDALQWLDVATTLGITPAGVAALVKLTGSSSHAAWVAASHALQAGLDTQQTAQLAATLDEALGAPASAYVIKTIAPSWVTDRNELYGWLLIDNKVSTQIKTTRIAEAIASVQLYVNRALTGQEKDVVNAVRSKTFFTSDWDTYNKRYSTWAGVSQLVYYPENYVDPTLRLGQTAMMDEMLQTLSQSQLTSDSVEEAFRTYMTRFEEIANLEVISGYHDGVSDQDGITYIIGRSDIGDYYWRSADIGKMSDGKLPANAWTEWKKITAALTPVNNLVRPVIFQSRLYLVWVESREVASYDKDKNNTTSTQEYLLKYAHILHDGTWSAPLTTKPNAGILSLFDNDVDNDVGMYCAKDLGQEKLYLYFYKKKDSYSSLPTDITGMSMLADGTTEDIPSTSADTIKGYIYLQLDTTTTVSLNTPYTNGSTEISISDASVADCSRGDGNYTIMSGGSVKGTSASLSDGKVVLNFDAIARIVYNGYEGERSRTQVDMMNSLGRIGDTYYLPETKKNGIAPIFSGNVFEFLYIPKPNKIGFSTIAFYAGASNIPDGGVVYWDINPSPDWLNTSSDKLRNGIGGFEQKNIQIATVELVPENYLYAAEGRKGVIGVMFGDFKAINTGIQTKNVTFSFGNQSVEADESPLKYSFNESLFNFTGKSITINLHDFKNNTAKLDFKASATADDGRWLGAEVFTITLTRIDKSSMPVISLNKTTDGAQYLQYGAHRIRVNTLFAKQLVSRANAGLDTVLSMDTQRLPEPKPGEGNYVTVTFSKYDQEKHGDGWFELYLLGTDATPDNSRSKHLYASGNVSAESETTLSLFLPWDPKKQGDEKYITYIGVKYSDKDYTITFSNIMEFIYDPASGTYEHVRDNIRGVTGAVNNRPSEPMDFNGANALYFWEMFYYVPMMVFKRLLSESRFTEACRWIKYIWSPDGYLQNDQPATWTWNVRPLEEETTWHVNPLDSVDPDAVAQADPMHYKIATFMAYLDLLIARGDAAYRQLERDTLNEAKMWYVQALNILGNEPYQPAGSGWASPRLSDAADKTTQKNVQQALMAVRQQVTSGELHTANSLTGLFLPQQNEKLAGYWQTLAQRLFNLRHNLSIDGNPLSLAIYAAPTDPSALLSAAVNSASGGSDLPAAVMPLYRFPVILDSARGMVSQLTQFGSTLLSLTERRDAEALSELLQTQGSQMIVQSIALQNSAITEIDAEKTALDAARDGAQSRLDSFTSLYDEDVNTGERQSMDLALAASVLSTTATVSYTVAAGLDAVPNIYGMAFGGSRYGSIARAVGTGIEITAMASRGAAERLGQSEAWRRRRQEWEIQRNNAEAEVNQIDAQLTSLAVRREGAMLQKTYLETQQAQTQAQMAFLQNKFTSKALYNWLRGKLSAIYYQFYDLTVSRCLMAEKAYQWALGNNNTSFIRPGAWQGTYAGLMAGETLMLNLAQMEDSYLKNDQRQKEVTRTVCLSEVYAGLSSDSFTLADAVPALVTAGKGSVGAKENGLAVADKQLQATLKLSELNIVDDYPAILGRTRRIKQVSVTLPALVGPYQDVRAVLSYGGSVMLPRGCTATAVSHGMNDSGQFQLNFNDGRWLPFEGIPVNDSGTLTLSFPDVDSKQKDLLLSLTDIILHIRYTIAS